MDSQGYIHHNVPPEDVPKRDLIEIPERELEALRGMNRHQRRAWYAKAKKLLRADAKAKAAKKEPPPAL